MKSEIRKHSKAIRNSMDTEQVLQKSRMAAGHFLDSSVYRDSKVLMLYMPLGNETDTSLIMEGAFHDGKKVVVPVTDTVNTDIIPCVVTEDTVFEAGAYSINEPDKLVKADETQIDVVLVPGIAFDKNGARIGFGKGYYDRFLSRTKALKVGFCYDFQLCEGIPAYEHDVPMDYVVTNSGIYKTNPKVN